MNLEDIEIKGNPGTRLVRLEEGNGELQFASIGETIAPDGTHRRVSLRGHPKVIIETRSAHIVKILEIISPTSQPS